MIYLALTPLRGGGKRLIKKIINKYRLGNEYKEIKENIENKGGSSSEDEVWYIVEESEQQNIVNYLKYTVTNIFAYYQEYNMGGYTIYYNYPLKFGDNGYEIYGICFKPFKAVNRLCIFEFKGNTIEDMINANIDEDTTYALNELKSHLKLSTKEEIEEYMNEQINQ